MDKALRRQIRTEVIDPADRFIPGCATMARPGTISGEKVDQYGQHVESRHAEFR
jgi:hypothetical protein